jgi:hypothetical protein
VVRLRTDFLPVTTTWAKEVVASKGINSSKQQIGYVLSGAGSAKNGHAENEASGAKGSESDRPISQAVSSKEVDHV